jgi:hypothetical protein
MNQYKFSCLLDATIVFLEQRDINLLVRFTKHRHIYLQWFSRIFKCFSKVDRDVTHVAMCLTLMQSSIAAAWTPYMCLRERRDEVLLGSERGKRRAMAAGHRWSLRGMQRRGAGIQIEARSGGHRSSRHRRQAHTAATAIRTRTLLLDVRAALKKVFHVSSL